jgi:hypothetical protein
MAGWVCPRLGGRFDLPEDKLEIYRPDREGFAAYIELVQRVEQEWQKKEQLQQLVEQDNTNRTS